MTHKKSCVRCRARAARAFLGEAEKTLPYDVGPARVFRPCIAGQKNPVALGPASRVNITLTLTQLSLTLYSLVSSPRPLNEPIQFVMRARGSDARSARLIQHARMIQIQENIRDANPKATRRKAFGLQLAKSNKIIFMSNLMHLIII